MTATRAPLQVLAVAVVFAAVSCGRSAPPQETTAVPAHNAVMDMHHIHELMLHGFQMALEGASTKMFGQMSMAGGVDLTTIAHGDAMMTEGRALIDKAISGTAMTAMHPANGNNPTMTYTHDLASAMTALLDRLQQMSAPNAKDMALHHMHVALTHAALMANQAASLKMTAAMNMSDAVDQDASAHAATMFEHARKLYDETMNGDAMKQAMTGGNGDSMGVTHNLGEAVKAAIDALSKMP